MSDGNILRDVLSSHFSAVLRREISNQEERVNNISKWEHIYKGHRDPKSFPHVNAANVAVPVSRVRTDTVFVRIIGAIWDRSKVWLFKALRPEFEGLDKEIEDSMDWFQKNILKFKHKILSPILQCVKTGTGIGYIKWREKRRTVYRYATDKELKDKSITKYKLFGTNRLGVTDIETEYVGPDFYPIDRKDFVNSSDASSIQDAYITGFKFPLRKQELDLRVKQGLYYEDEVEKIVTPSGIDEEKEKRAEMQGKEISYEKDTQPYDLWELWAKYDVNEDGEEDDIVLTLNLESGAICKAIYNPLFKGFKPFIDFVFYPMEYSFDGEGVVEILEKPQIEIDSLHNQRLDRMSQINAPIIFVRAGSGLENYKLSPGEVKIVNDELETSIREFRFSDTTFSTYPEEDRLVAYCDRAVGTPPVAMGFVEADRPVAKETFARQHEANRRFLYGIQNVMYKVVETAYMFLEFFAQYQPEYSYKTDIQGRIEEKTVNFPLEYIRDGFRIEIAGSHTLLTQEHRREISLTKYQILSDYYTKTAGMIAALAAQATPVELKRFLYRTMEKGDKLISDILADFDERDTEEYQINAREFIDRAIVERQPIPLPTQATQGEQTTPTGGVRY